MKDKDAIILFKKFIDAASKDETTENENEEMLTIEEVFQRFKIKRHTLWRRIKEGRIVATKTGNSDNSHVLIYAQSLREYLKANIISPENPKNKDKGSDKK